MWHKLKNRIWKWRGVLLTAPTVAGLALAAGSAGWFQLLDWATLDLFFRLRPREPVDERIVIVTIDEPDITHVGQWPVPDAVLARALNNLKEHQPRAIGLDLYRDLPVAPGHQALVGVFKSTPNLIGVEKAVGDSVAPPPTLKELGQVGLADLVLDADGKVRRGLLSVREDSGETKLSLGATLALMYLQAEGIAPQRADPKKTDLKLGQAVFVPFAGNDGGYVGANAGGYQILLNFRGPQTSFPTVSLRDVLENRIPPNLLRDRIVLIGATGQSLNDLFLTPYSSSFAGSPKRTPGAVIHANLTSQILSGALQGRPFIRVWDERAEWLWVLSWSFTGAAGSWAILEAKLFKKNVFLRWTFLGICIVLVGSSLAAGSFAAFVLSWWIPGVAPLVAFTGSSIWIAGYHSRELQRQSEKKLAQFLEAVPVGVTVVDATGKVYYSNRAAVRLLGKGIVPDAKSENFAEVYQLYIAGTEQLYPPEKSPLVRALKGEASIAHDIEIRQGDKIISIESMGTPVRDEFGNIAYAIAAFQDITERKKAEADRDKLVEDMFSLNCDLELALDAEEQLTDAYGRFVPHEFLHFLGYESITEAKLGDCVQMDMSILFSDIRDFTTVSETMTPEDNFKFINAYLSRMEPAIAEHQGFIDKYIGDAIMALFGGGADNAVKAGIAMLNLLAEYNTTRGRPGRPLIQIGIGINTGSLMLGTVGGQSRMNGTVISDAVNLASRLEGLTKNYGVSMLISHHTFMALNNTGDYAIRLIDKVKVKGKSEMVTVYEVFDADPPEVKEGKSVTRTDFEEALLLYNIKAFRDAAQLFQHCLQVNPGDRVAQIYLERCQGFGPTGGPENK
ncbi:MAG: CHASE2 domain-containing protein [Oscillatoria princeps RMCB-10]|jgi:CHASE2 domain-containing sensor protein/class 3 adenylate cyclase|nr:CHASE2 domain-containing protein [Oscillatoria princeps RMCB-10]